jgi:hypothetical protein
MLNILLYSYAAATLLVALRLGWHMVFKLDRYDWHYDKGDIWSNLGLYVLLWPLVLMMKLRTRGPAGRSDEAPARRGPTLDPAKIFSNPNGAAARARLRDNPPPCGTVIRYRQADGFSTAFGEFLFRAEAVERVLVNRIREYPHLKNDVDGVILNWVRRRDRGFSEPTEMPALWDFRSGANDLVREGEGKVRCIKCDETFPTGALIPRDEHGRPGWNIDLLICPRGHELLEVRKYHIAI